MPSTNRRGVGPYDTLYSPLIGIQKLYVIPMNIKYKLQNLKERKKKITKNKYERKERKTWKKE